MGIGGSGSRLVSLFVLELRRFAPYLEACFSYCAIFPKDTVINVDRLIRIWMAQGYLSTVENKQQEVKGREYFMNLATRSFFHELKKDDKNASVIISCKMHDIVHDFAQFLGKMTAIASKEPKQLKTKQTFLVFVIYAGRVLIVQ